MIFLKIIFDRCLLVQPPHWHSSQILSYCIIQYECLKTRYTCMSLLVSQTMTIFGIISCSFQELYIFLYSDKRISVYCSINNEILSLSLWGIVIYESEYEWRAMEGKWKVTDYFVFLTLHLEVNEDDWSSSKLALVIFMFFIFLLSLPHFFTFSFFSHSSLAFYLLSQD